MIKYVHEEKIIVKNEGCPKSFSDSSRRHMMFNMNFPNQSYLNLVEFFIHITIFSYFLSLVENSDYDKILIEEILVFINNL